MEVLQNLFLVQRVAMKRKRNSTKKANREAHQVFDEIPQKTSPFTTDLPKPIFIDILLRLTVKGIIMCKSVCKTWYCLITDPEFAKLHFAQAEVCPLLRTMDSTRVSRMLYLIEPRSFNSFDLGYCGCSDDSFSSECDCHINSELDTRLKIPLRNYEVVLNNKNDVAKMGIRVAAKRKRCVKLKPKDHKFKIVNSCNGFLCLSEPSRNDPVVVCNPITGEYVNLPVATSANEKDTRQHDCGFGFNPQTKQYKVVRIFDISEEYGRRCRTVAEVHTLGTGLWKTIDKAPPRATYKLAFPTYLNGFLYWFYIDYIPNFIVSFDFDNEQFESVPPPPIQRGIFCSNTVNTTTNMCMGVLRGCLCVFDASQYDPIDIWVLKKSSNQQSWSKEFSISTYNWWPYGLHQPISCLKNGALLMFHYPKSVLICWDPERNDHKYLKIRGVKSKFEAIAYIPSFISLKDAVTGDNVAVLNIKDRCAKLKVQGETKAVSIEEAENSKERASDPSSYDDDKWHKQWWSRS